MKTLEVSDFWLWFSNSRMFGTASCNSLDFPSWMQMTPQYPVIAPVFKAETRKQGGRTSRDCAFYLVVF